MIATLVLVATVSCWPAATAGAIAARASAAATGTLTVTPSTDLVDGQTIQVSGTGFSPGGYISLFICSDTSQSFFFCNYEDEDGFDGQPPLLADQQGDFSTTIVASRYFEGGPQLVDCAQTSAHCFVQAQGVSGNSTISERHDISFDPTKPGLPPTVITLSLGADSYAVEADGSVDVTGTVTCNLSATLQLQVTLSQAGGILSANSTAQGTTPCNTTPTSWTVSAIPSTGSFQDGEAIMDVSANQPYPSASAYTQGAVTLTGAVPVSQYYVALGDSLAAGFAAPAGQGYVNDLAADLRPTIPGLGMANFGCSSETTETMMNGGICQYSGSKSQLTAAEAFLAANRGHVPLITIDIGGNDAIGCDGQPPSVIGTCFANALTTMDSNIRSMLAGIRAAAGPGVPIVAMNYFDPLLYRYFDGSDGPATAQGSVASVAELNQHLAADYGAFHVPVADVFDAFSTTNTNIVNSKWGPIPFNVFVACALLDVGCGPGNAGFGDDANAAGYKVITAALESVVVLAPANRSFVEAASTDFLGAVPSNLELAGDTSNLTDGSVSRRAFLAGLVDSPAWLDATVEAQYEAVLGRPADTTGLGYWTARLGSGQVSVAQVSAALWGSSEALATDGGGSVSTWIGSMYQQLLGRPADDAGLAYWTAQVGDFGRTAVAYRLVQSAESARRRVDGLYQQLLGRAPDASGLAYWSGQVVANGDLSLALELAASHEYLAGGGPLPGCLIADRPGRGAKLNR